MRARLTAGWLILGSIGGAHAATPEIERARLPDDVRAKQIQNMKWGMFICWSFSSFYGQEWTPTKGRDASFFKATGCETDQWCQTAKDAGMGYILFLAKHHDGFCLWDTKTTEKKVTNSPIGAGGLSHEETVEWMRSFQPNTFVGFNHGQPAGRLCLRERGRPGKIGDRSA